MKKFILNSLNGMAYGLFATLIVGVILQQVGILIKWDFLSSDLYTLLSRLMGVGIGLGIGIALNKDGLPLVMLAIAGGIATSFILDFKTFEILTVTGPGNPLTAYFVPVLSYLVMNILIKKKTPVDIILIPIIMIIFAVFFTFLLSFPLNFITSTISKGVDKATTFSPLLMTIAISVLMGMILTSPISSAAVSFAIGLNGIAAGAAVVGTSIQMIGFAIQSRRDNNIGKVISIGIGTSMLQFKNIVKKPIIWLPTIISSAIVAPILLIFDFKSNSAGAGMGTSGLVGPLQSLHTMEYNWQSFVSVILIVVLGGLLVYIFDKIMYIKGIIQKDDLSLDDSL